MLRSIVLSLFSLFSLGLACGGDPDVCAPGGKVDCACDGVPGYRFCATDRKSYGACDCSVPSASTQCQALETSHPIQGRTHVETCSAVTFDTMPPSSGNHYPIWANFETYAEPVDPGFFVHSLEHGAVILFYNCPDGCADDVAKAQALINDFGGDFVCSEPVKNRLILMPLPTLDVRFAAAAWGWTLRSQCFDADLFKTFAAAHYAQGPEATCGEGYSATDLRDICTKRRESAKDVDLMQLTPGARRARP